MRTGELVRSVKHSVAGPRCAEKRANQTTSGNTCEDVPCAGGLPFFIHEVFSEFGTC